MARVLLSVAHMGGEERDFVKEAEQFDDITMLGFLYRGPKK